MGTVTGASAVAADGSLRPVSLDAALSGDEGLVELAYAYGPDLIPSAAPSVEGMWRWERLLPLEPGPIHYPLAVGGTPLLAGPGLRAMSGLPHLFLKDETRSPTGSNKDRATGLVLEHALRRGVTTVTAASTGNVAVSLAVGGGASQIKAVIFVPASVGEGKLRLMLVAGATVFKVEAGYEAAFRLSRQAARAFGWYDRNTGVNPITVEAKKTVAFEIWDQLGRSVPDAVVIPVGDGTTLSAMAKGFRELIACEVADRMPRIIGVQAAGCQPLKAAWEGVEMPEVTGTLADGIFVDAPANGVTALRDVRESGGGFVAVSDDAILDAIQVLARQGGVLAEPAAAASFAAMRPALEAGLIERGERVVGLVTGTGLKTPQYLAPSGSVFQIGGALDEVAGALG